MANLVDMVDLVNLVMPVILLNLAILVILVDLVDLVNLLILMNCETQRFTDQKLSSPMFPCCLFVCSFVRIGNISTYLNCMMF